MPLNKIPADGLSDSGVTAGTYGSASAIPTITVNKQGQVIAAGTAALDLSVKVSKTGDTMTGNLAIQNAAPTINMIDTDGTLTKAVHHNSDLIGFLGNQGQWIQSVNNSGQISTPAYGWLHDKFAQRTTVLGAQGAARDTGIRTNCGNVNCNIVNTLGTEIFDSGDGRHQLRTYYSILPSLNCNCDCACC